MRIVIDTNEQQIVQQSASERAEAGDADGGAAPPEVSSGVSSEQSHASADAMDSGIPPAWLIAALEKASGAEGPGPELSTTDAEDGGKAPS
jgi:hypothetical protein